MEPEALREKIVLYLKGEMEEAEMQAFEATLARWPEGQQELAETRELLDALSAASEEHVARGVSRILAQAAERGAREIHLVPERDAVIVYMRIGEGLEEALRYDRALHAPTIDRWKHLADCSIAERELPQEGRMSLQHAGREYDVSVTCLPTVSGERVTARLAPRAEPAAALAELGFGPLHVERLQELLARPSGLLLVAGPVGAGHRDVLHALLGEARAREVQPSVILTVEEEVERVLDGVCQVAVDPARGLTFAAALRAAIRSSPEILLVSDLPEAETTRLALRGAVEGRRVLAGLVSRGAAGGIRRLCEQSGDAHLVAQALTGVVGLRRVRRTCAGCATEYRPSPELLRIAALSWSEDGPFRQGTGCDACRETGYEGSTHLVELLSVEDALRPLIASDATEEAIQSVLAWRSVGTFWDDAREKIRSGVTTVEEARRTLLGEPPPQLGTGRPMLPTGV